MQLTIDALLALAVLIALLSCIGVMAMRDAFQRLQFGAIIVAFCPLALAIAAWMDHPDAQARIKVILIGVILVVTNSVLATATAKATRIRLAGHFDPAPGEAIPVAEVSDVNDSIQSGRRQ